MRKKEYNNQNCVRKKEVAKSGTDGVLLFVPTVFFTQVRFHMKDFLCFSYQQILIEIENKAVAGRCDGSSSPFVYRTRNIENRGSLTRFFLRRFKL